MLVNIQEHDNVFFSFNLFDITRFSVHWAALFCFYRLDSVHRNRIYPGRRTGRSLQKADFMVVAGCN
jgi:hypothetical protein